jgi:flagellar biosynthesis protein FlhF
MRVKKFNAKTMKEALKAVKLELGPEAIILSAREVKGTYQNGYVTSVELTAAVSEFTQHKKDFVESRMTVAHQAQFRASGARQQKQVIEEMVEKKLKSAADANDRETALRGTSSGITRGSGRDTQSRNQQGGQTSTTSGSSQSDIFENRRPTSRNYIDIRDEESIGVGQGVSSAAERIRNATRDALESFSTVDGAPEPASRRPVRTGINRMMTAATDAFSEMGRTRDASRSAQALAASVGAENRTEVKNLKGEIDRLQGVISQFQQVPQTIVSKHAGHQYGLSAEFSTIYQKMLDVGVHEDIIGGVLQKAAREIHPDQLKKRAFIDAWLAKYLLEKVNIVEQPTVGRMHLFVGPSGSGKTSQLVKMASHLVVKQRKRVAIISCDTSKVGSVEQMKIYSQILNVPFAVVRSQSDWEWLWKQAGSVDHILVDFPGLQLRQMEDIEQLNSVLPPKSFGAKVHLVLSATAKDSDLTEAVKRYKMTDFSDFIFTGLDLSAHHGLIWNIHDRFTKPIHSFGVGNRIPEDMEFASKERILDLMFKLSKLNRS